MLVDVALVKNHIKTKATSTLRNMKKDARIEDMRTSEYDCDTAVAINNQQAGSFLRSGEECKEGGAK